MSKALHWVLGFFHQWSLATLVQVGSVLTVIMKVLESADFLTRIGRNRRSKWLREEIIALQEFRDKVPPELSGTITNQLSRLYKQWAVRAEQRRMRRGPIQSLFLAYKQPTEGATTLRGIYYFFLLGMIGWVFGNRADFTHEPGPIWFALGSLLALHDYVRSFDVLPTTDKSPDDKKQQERA